MQSISFIFSVPNEIRIEVMFSKCQFSVRILGDKLKLDTNKLCDSVTMDKIRLSEVCISLSHENGTNFIELNQNRSVHPSSTRSWI